MNSRQVAKRAKTKAAKMFHMEKISRKEYGSVLIGCGWFTTGQFHQMLFCKVNGIWFTASRYIEQR